MQLSIGDKITFIFSTSSKPIDGIIYKIEADKIGVKSKGYYYTIDKSCILGVILNGYLEPV